MKLVQLNTWSCSLSPSIVEFLDKENPDFITFQEAVSSQFGGKILETIDEILTSHPFRDSYYTPLVEFAFMHHRASRGNLISSQLPIVAKNELWTHGEYTEDFDYVDSGGYNVARNVAHVEVSINNQPLHVLTLHGFHVKAHKNGNDETLKACQILKDYAAQLHGAVIITGDFNLTPTSESMKIFNEDFRNLSVENNLSTTRNKLTTKNEVCDYILVNDKVTVNNFSMPEDIISDHNALVLDFDIK